MLSRTLRLLGLGVFCGVLSLSCLRAEQPLSTPQKLVAAVKSIETINQIYGLSKKITQAEALYVAKEEMLRILFNLKHANDNIHTLLASKDFLKEDIKKSLSRIIICLLIGVSQGQDWGVKLSIQLCERLQSFKNLLDSFIAQDSYAAAIFGVLVAAASGTICYRYAPTFGTWNNSMEKRICSSLGLGVLLGGVAWGGGRLMFVHACMDKVVSWCDGQVKATDEFFLPYMASIAMPTDTGQTLAILDQIYSLSHNVSSSVVVDKFISNTSKKLTGLISTISLCCEKLLNLGNKTN